MARPLKVLIMSAATAGAILLIAAVAFYALRLLIVGEAWTVVPEVSITEALKQAPRGIVRFSPTTRPVVVPLLAAAMLLAGLLTRKLVIAWIGLAVLFLFSALFLFSIGAGLLPMAGLLLILLTIITVLQGNLSQTT